MVPSTRWYFALGNDRLVMFGVNEESIPREVIALPKPRVLDLLLRPISC